MIVKKIGIENFRGFEKEEFNFNSKFNVIIGDNALGKTTLLEALSACLGGFLSGIQYKSRKSISKRDIRIINYSKIIKRANKARLDINTEIFEKEYNWTRERILSEDKLSDLTLYEEVYSLGKQLKKSVSEGKFTTLPIVSYYGTGRLMKDNEISFNSELNLTRFDGYTKALNPNSNYRTLINWFKTNEISVYKSGKKIKIVQSMKKAIRNSFDEIETIFYDYENDVLSVLLKTQDGKKTIPIHNLSDGQRNLIGLIGDIALRCNLLNPRFEEKAHLMTPGVILIDEIGQHLHPKWQRQIVGILKDTFPRIQFIVTTHSPFVIQSLKNRELIDLNNKELYSDYFRKSIDEITVEEMGVENSIRSKLFLKMEKAATDFFKEVSDAKNSKNDEKIKELKNELKKLQIEYDEDPSYVALLRAEINSK